MYGPLQQHRLVNNKSSVTSNNTLDTCESDPDFELCGEVSLCFRTTKSSCFMMNPLTNTRNITKLSEQDLRKGGKSSWHDEYSDSAWIFVGGLPYDLTEGDILAVFSQYGEVVNINLVRDKVTGKQKGFCFICYEDQRSTILAVDNFNGIKLIGRTIRVDHVKDYKVPKESKHLDNQTKQLHDEGCGPDVVARNILDLKDEDSDELLSLSENERNFGQNIPSTQPEIDTSYPKKKKNMKTSSKEKKAKKSSKKHKKSKSSSHKKKHKSKTRHSSSSDQSSSS